MYKDIKEVLRYQEEQRIKEINKDSLIIGLCSIPAVIAVNGLIGMIVMVFA